MKKVCRRAGTTYRRHLAGTLECSFPSANHALHSKVMVRQPLAWDRGRDAPATYRAEKTPHRHTINLDGVIALHELWGVWEVFVDFFVGEFCEEGADSFDDEVEVLSAPVGVGVGGVANCAVVV